MQGGYPIINLRTKEISCSNAFDNLVTGNLKWVYFFEPKRKCSNRFLETKNATPPSIAKRIRTVKVKYIFFDNNVQDTKGKGVIGKFYKPLKDFYRSRRPKRRQKTRLPRHPLIRH